MAKGGANNVRYALAAHITHPAPHIPRIVDLAPLVSQEARICSSLPPISIPMHPFFALTRVPSCLVKFTILLHVVYIVAFVFWYMARNVDEEDCVCLF